MPSALLVKTVTPLAAETLKDPSEISTPSFEGAFKVGKSFAAYFGLMGASLPIELCSGVF